MTGNLFLKKKSPFRPGTLVNIDVADIDPNPAQPRRAFDDEAMLRLANSIRRHGVLQPLAVRKLGERFVLIAGERRLRAVVICGLKSVPCVILDADDCATAEMAIIENIQRSSLNMFEEAEAISRLAADCRMTQEQIAKRLDTSQSYVANKLRLLKMPEKVRDLILEAGLTERHARAILRLSGSDQQITALSYIIRRGLNVAATEEYVDALLSPRPAPTKPVVMSDTRLLMNSIDKAVAVASAAGADVHTTRRESNDATEIRIVIGKR